MLKIVSIFKNNGDVFTSQGVLTLYQYFCFSFDGWEVSPTSITLGETIGEGAFGTVFAAAVDEEIMKILKYWKQRSKGFNLVENNFEVAVKKVKGNKTILNSFYWLLPDEIIKVY